MVDWKLGQKKNGKETPNNHMNLQPFFHFNFSKQIDIKPSKNSLLSFSFEAAICFFISRSMLSQCLHHFYYSSANDTVFVVLQTFDCLHAPALHDYTSKALKDLISYRLASFEDVFNALECHCHDIQVRDF